MQMERLVHSIGGIVRGEANPLCASCLTALTAADNVDIRVAMIGLALGDDFRLGTTCGRCGAPEARGNPVLSPRFAE